MSRTAAISAVVLVGAGQDGDVGVVLGGRADQGGPADVDVLDRLGQGCVGPRDGGLERIQVDDDQVDRQETLALERGQVVGIVAASQDSAVDLGVQGLDPAAENFGLAGVVGDFGDLETGGHERRPGAAAGQELGAARRQGLRQLDQSSLVENTDQGPTNRDDRLAHGCDSGDAIRERLNQRKPPHLAVGHPLSRRQRGRW